MLLVLSFIIIVISLFFRIYNLGYSEFQGDEVAAQNYLFDERAFWDFLLSRNIGPGQFVITKIFNNIFYGSEYAEYFLRIPFLLASFISLILILYLTQKFYKNNSAFPTTIFCGLSGLFIGFSKVVQYQSFVIMIILISLILFFKYLQNKKTKFLVLCGITSGIGVLFHYDSLSILFSIILYLLVKKKFISIIEILIPFFGVTFTYFLFYAFSGNISGTLSYLVNERIFDNSRLFIERFLYLDIFQIYHPKEFIVLFLYGIFLAILYFIKSKEDIINFTFIWFVLTLVLYGLVVSEPLTHIYTILLPGYILAGLGLGNMLSKNLLASLVIIGFCLIPVLSFNYQAFIDITPEYPWNEKNYVFGVMPSKIARSNNFKGVYGFPYYRGWRNASAYFNDFIDSSYGKDKRNLISYGTNEKSRLAKYYLKDYKYKETEYDYYIWVDNNQNSFNFQTSETPIYQSSSIKIFSVK